MADDVILHHLYNLLNDCLYNVRISFNDRIIIIECLIDYVINVIFNVNYFSQYNSELGLGWLQHLLVCYPYKAMYIFMANNLKK